MNDKELYQQKKQAQIDEWAADMSKLKAKASMASADAQLKMNEHIRELEEKLGVTKSKLDELKESAEDKYESMKLSVESAWDKLGTAFNDVKAKFKS